MLQASPSKNSEGITIYGDYSDLNTLYNVIHEIAETLNETDINQKGQHLLLLNFAYEIRKAFSGNRLTKRVKIDGNGNQINYYGSQFAWTDILIFIATLRINSQISKINKLQQANLYMLEYVVERALDEYNLEGATKIKDYIGKGINVTNQYVFIIYQALNRLYLNDTQGLKRFRNIPKLLENYFNESSKEYKTMIGSLQLSAKKENCDINDLEFEDLPELNWED
jgi:hypothetical protein